MDCNELIVRAMSSRCKTFYSLLDWDAIGRRGSGGRVGGTVDAAILGGIYLSIFIFCYVCYLSQSIEDILPFFPLAFVMAPRDNLRASSSIGWKSVGHMINHGKNKQVMKPKH